MKHLFAKPQKLAPDPDPAPDFPPNPDPPKNLAEAAWPFNSDSPVIAEHLRVDRFLAIMLVDVCGLDWDTIKTHLPMIREVSSQKQMVPVLIVDLMEFGALAAENLAYDTLPNATANAAFAPERDWAAYCAYRRALLREKWRPSAIVKLGQGQDWGKE